MNLGSIYPTGGLSLPRAYQSHYFAGPPLKTSNPSGGVALEEISPVNEHFPGIQSSYTSPSGAGRTRARDADDVDGSHGEPQPRRKKSRKLTAGAAAGSSDDNVTGNNSGKSGTHAPQYVCVTCGRTDSPEWRKGPLGAKTLCNACGLRWAKRNQRKKAETAANTVAEEDEAATAAKETTRQPQETEEATA
jgi:hypothetical protein